MFPNEFNLAKSIWNELTALQLERPASVAPEPLERKTSGQENGLHLIDKTPAEIRRDQPIAVHLQQAP